MQYVSGPKVKLISRPEIDFYGLSTYLEEVGADGYIEEMLDRHDDPAEMLDHGAELVLTGGKLCYRSWEPGLNPNVSKVRDDPGAYIANIVRSGHGSVLEHANYSFVFSDVSRVFTHELVRHRHEAVSQESLRYVRLDELRFWIPDELEEVKDMVHDLLEQMEEFQKRAAKIYHLDDPDVPFSRKKIITSALRRVAPIGLSTAMMWTANLRSLRHIIEMRTSPHAEVEIRMVFDQVAEIMKQECPDVFADFTRDPDGAWVSGAPKI